jgi:hypothetical protein
VCAVSYEKISGGKPVHAFPGALLLPRRVKRFVVAHATARVKSHALNGQALQLAHFVFVVCRHKRQGGSVLLGLVIGYFVHTPLVVCSIKIVS